LIEIQCLLKAVLWTNWLTVVIHANSFAPFMDAICPRAFLIECVDALYKGVGDVEAGYYEPVDKLKDCI